jgi:hypothetical protein
MLRHGHEPASVDKSSGPNGKLSIERVVMLPVRQCSEDFLVRDDGQPIWPVRDTADEAALRALLATIGGTLNWVDGGPGRSERGPELVVGLGNGSEEAAELYGQLTGRRVKLLSRHQQLFAHDQVDVLVCSWAELTFALLETLEDYGRQIRPVGLIVAGSREALRHQVLIRSATSRVCYPPVSRAVLIGSQADADGFGTEAEGLRTLVGKFSRAARRSALESRPAVLGVFGHGDGLDMQFGDDHVLCPLAEAGLVDSPGARALDCVDGGHCYRLGRPLGEALTDERLVSPSEIQCRLAVLWTCFAIPATRSLVKPEVSLLRPVIDSPTVGAAFATWGVALQNATNLRRFVDHSLGTSTLGALMSWFYADETLSGGTRACLFGDPRSRVLPAEMDPDPC